MHKHTILITGGAGYIGSMLVMRFAAREDVEKIIVIDRARIPDSIRKEPKLVYLNTNTADDWEEKVREHEPDIVVHAAWQIRELYGAQDMQRDWNIGGSEKVFDYALGEKAVRRLVHFSTIASYGAYPDNSVSRFFTEEDPLRQSDYSYAEEKREAETRLEEKYEKSAHKPAVAVVRPASITGPFGRYANARFGLQAALAGQLSGSALHRFVSLLVAWVPITPKWVRQYIHEDDVAAIVERLAFDDVSFTYEAFNLCPPGPVVRGADMAGAVGKKTLSVSPWMVRLAFFLAWHLTRGRIPTSRGVWKGYSFPIPVDGSKVTRVLGYAYKHAGLDAFCYTDGEHESVVPERLRRHKSA